MELILLVTCLALSTLIGYSLLSIILYKSEPFSFFEKLFLSYGLGMGAVTLEILLFYFLRINLNIFNIILPWIPVIIFSLLFFRSKPLYLTEQRHKFSLLEKFLLAGISLEIILAFFRALIKPLESFDSIAMYAMLSKIIYLSGAIPSDFFTKITLNYPNPDYPLLVPLAEVWVYTFLGNLNDLLVKAVFPMYLLSFLVIFFFLLRRFMPRKESLLFTFLLGTIPQFNRFASIGYTDLILAYYYSIGVIFLYLWMNKRNLNLLLLSAIFSGLAVWTKNEGILLCLINLILLSIFLLSNFRKEGLRIFKHIVIFVMLVILISGPWLALRISMRLENDLFQFSTMGIKRFADISRKLVWVPSILYEFQKQFFGPKKWNIIWVLFLVLLLFNLKRSFSDDLKFLTLSIILVMFFYGTMYLLIPVEGSISWYLGTTVSRLFIHFVPVTVFWLAQTCYRYKFLD